MQRVGIGSLLRSLALHLTAAGLSVCQHVIHINWERVVMYRIWKS